MNKKKNRKDTLLYPRKWVLFSPIAHWATGRRINMSFLVIGFVFIASFGLAAKGVGGGKITPPLSL